MSIWAVTMVKDEMDILPQNINWLLENVDNILISDNLSTDGTSDYLSDMCAKYNNIYTVLDQDPAYRQSEKMNGLFRHASSIDPDIEWILPFDADEFWIGPDQRHFKSLLNIDCDVILATVWHMVSSLGFTSTTPLHDINWRQESPEKFPVVAFRPNSEASIHMGNHNIDWPGARVSHGTLEVRHYQYRSLEQFKRKVRNGKAAFDVTNFDQGVGAHWRSYGSMSDEQLESIWNEWASEPGLIFDPW